MRTRSKADLEKTIENRHLEDEILEVRVPMQEVVEMKNGAKKTVQKKLFPGYVLVNMIMNDDTWYVVRNTRGVTGFVGPGSKPVPLSEAEMKPLGIKSDNVSIDFTEGDTIVVVAGAWKDTVGAVYKIDYNKQTVTINVELFGRDTPVEISFSEVRKIRLSVLGRGHRDVQWSDPLSSGSSVLPLEQEKTLRHTTIYLGGA